jgi:putative membrane protein
MLAAGMPSTDPWRFQVHPEVWLLVASLIAAYVYLVRVVGPRVVRPGEPVVTKRQRWCFVATMLLLLVASDWPMHDIAEEYLYSAHMLQHMILTYFMPPLALLATPTWLMRLLIGNGRAYAVLRWLTKPVVAGFAFNIIIMVSHIPGVVNASTGTPVLHYSIHFGLVMLSLLMWMPLVGPLPELQLGPGGKMVYLFAQSVVPTVPAGWLTFAEKAVYKHYDHPVRVFGSSVVNDQQIAGVIMKIGGSVFLWAVIIFFFFKRFTAGFDKDNDNSYVRPTDAPTPTLADVADATGDDGDDGDDGVLTYEQVTAAFERSAPIPERPSR